MHLSEVFCHVCQVRIADYVAVVEVLAHGAKSKADKRVITAELDLCKHCLEEEPHPPPIVRIRSYTARPMNEVVDE